MSNQPPAGLAILVPFEGEDELNWFFYQAPSIRESDGKHGTGK